MEKNRALSQSLTQLNVDAREPKRLRFSIALRETTFDVGLLTVKIGATALGPFGGSGVLTTRTPNLGVRVVKTPIPTKN